MKIIVNEMNDKGAQTKSGPQPILCMTWELKMVLKFLRVV